MEIKNKIVFISGPTSSGKSNLALRIAKKIKGEIINADSMQVYKELKIITARPLSKDQKKIKHHLYGHRSGNVRYNVYNWCKEASKKINEISKNKKVPIVVGGTGLYFHSLINGIAKLPSIPEKIKKEGSLILNEKGWNKFFNETKKFDCESCLQLKKNDSQRLKRIWEVFKYTGIPLSHWKKNTSFTFIKKYNYDFILILPNRKDLYANCDNRFLKMIDLGAIEEVKKLKDKKYDLSLPIMKAHGVPELIKYVSDIFSLDEAIIKAQQATKRYVKRQFTWWRGSNIKPDLIFNYFPSNIDLNRLEILKKYTN